jgi:hypothetical protein
MTSRVRTPADVPALEMNVGDCWTDFSRVRVAGSDIRLPLATVHTSRASRARFDAFLRIGYVTSWSVADPPQIAIGSIDRVSFDVPSSTLTVRSIEPLALVARVTSLDVTLETETTSPVSTA